MDINKNMENSIEEILKLIIEGKFKDAYTYEIRYSKIWVVINNQTIIIERSINRFRRRIKATVKFSDKNILDNDYYLNESSIPIIKSFDVDISLYDDLKRKFLEEDNIKKQEKQKRKDMYEKEISDKLASIVDRNKQ